MQQQDPKAILLSILRQLAAPLPGLPIKSPVIAVFDKETIRGSQEAHLSLDETTSILSELIQNHYDNVTLVLDALDECKTKSRCDLLDTFAKLTFNPRTRVKTLISSRNEPDIKSHFSKTPNVMIKATDNSDDITIFVAREINRRLLGGKARKRLKERVVNELNTKANGVFRWAALQVDALSDQDHVYSEEDVMYLLPKLPETLEDTYLGIINQFRTLPPSSCETIESVLKLLVCAEYPMSVRQVLGALGALSGAQRVMNDIAAILRLGRGLIATELGSSWLVFTHLSVKEFLEQKPGLSGESAHQVAAEACLKTYLSRRWGTFEADEFRQYALSHLGRHCRKSGALKQRPNLLSLMQKFLLDEETNDAFVCWNRECFQTDLETAVGTCDERRRCQSLPSLPLFMICVYGFNEFVEPAICKGSRALFAENFYGERPLEVATIYSNYDTMVAVYHFAKSAHPSSIRANEWIREAAQTSDLKIWNFVVEHIPDVSLERAIAIAAQNLIHGAAMTDSLLRRLESISEEAVGSVLISCASFETLENVLEHSVPFQYTESLLEAAVKNKHLNPKLTKMILSKAQAVRVSEDAFLSVILSSDYPQSTRLAVITILLEHPTRCGISEEMLCKALHYGGNLDIDCFKVLFRHCPIDHLTEDCLAAAAHNVYTDSSLLEHFMNFATDHPISQEVFQSAILGRGYQPRNKFEALLSRSKQSPVLEESLYVMTETWSHDFFLLPTALEACQSIPITDAFVQACAANRSVSELEYVISLPRAFPISKDALHISVTNFADAREVLEFLQQRSSLDLELSEDTFLQALSNASRDLSLIGLFARQWKTLPITENTMMAAVRHDSRREGIFDFVLPFCESVQEILTQNVLHAAIEGDNFDFVQFFLQKKPDLEVQKETLKIAITSERSNGTNNAILRALLALPRRFPISKDLVDVAVQQGDGSMLELLSEQPGVSELLHSERSMEYSDTNENPTIDMIILSASRKAIPGEFSYDLSTKRLDSLLSRYDGPTPDGSRLIEVAAEREDGKFVVQYLLSRFPNVPITRSALLAATSNEKALTTLLDLLLTHSGATVDSDLMRAAVTNKYRGSQMVELLLAKSPADMFIERDVVLAALGNQYCGRHLFNLFLQQQPDFIVAQDVIDTASRNDVLGRVLLQMLLKHALISRHDSSADLIFNKMRSIADGVRDSLFMAVCYGDDMILNWLISRNIPIDTVSGELGTALNVAVYCDNAFAVRLLLETGCDPESLSHLYGTALATACRKENADIARMLCQYGADVNRQDSNGRIELHLALRKGRVSLVNLLLSLGASMAVEDHQGMSAMHHAALYTISSDCAHHLIESGVPLDQEDSYRWTPLHWAAKSGVSETVTRLIEAGADKTKRDASGKTPLQIATFCGNIHLKPILSLPDEVDLESDLASEMYQNVVCDGCDLVSLRASSLYQD